MGYGERGGLPIEWVRYLVLVGEIYQNVSKKSGRSAIEPQKNYQYTKQPTQKKSTNNSNEST